MRFLLLIVSFLAWTSCALGYDVLTSDEAIEVHFHYDCADIECPSHDDDTDPTHERTSILSVSEKIESQKFESDAPQKSVPSSALQQVTSVFFLALLQSAKQDPFNPRDRFGRYFSLSPPLV